MGGKRERERAVEIEMKLMEINGDEYENNNGTFFDAASSLL